MAIATIPAIVGFLGVALIETRDSTKVWIFLILTSASDHANYCSGQNGGCIA